MDRRLGGVSWLLSSDLERKCCLLDPRLLPCLLLLEGSDSDSEDIACDEAREEAEFCLKKLGAALSAAAVDVVEDHPLPGFSPPVMLLLMSAGNLFWPEG